jgi:hypothetical protein
MNEMVLLAVFYYEMVARGLSYDAVFLSVDESMVGLLDEEYNIKGTLEDLEKIADVCIANKWLQRTSADPYYNFLSLTEKGLQKIMDFEYQNVDKE